MIDLQIISLNSDFANKSNLYIFKTKLMSTILKTQSVILCPVCNSEGETFLDNCPDRICHIPGNWSFKKCQECDSIWLDPFPQKDIIPTLYPDNYDVTHLKAEQPLKEPQKWIRKFIYAFKLGVIERNFNYHNLNHKTTCYWGFFLGKLFGFIPSINRRVGHSIKFLPYRSQGRLLEVGSGNGNFLWLMSQLGWQVEGIEPDPLAVQVANNNGFNVYQSGIEEADLKPNSYDAIVLNHVIEHIPEPKQALEKLVDSLKEGGVLISISPNPVGLGSIVFGNKWNGLSDTPRHLILPSPKGYQKMLSDKKIKPKIFTNMQIGAWMYKESISIYKTGEVGKYSGKFIPKIASQFVSLLLPIFPNFGEEVICYVVK